MIDFDINQLKFDDKGLIPAIVVDSITKKVLTLAYMNRESLEISIKKGLTCFYSRSRQELWLKGETSGNYQHIVSITADCDMDALTVVVEKDGSLSDIKIKKGLGYGLDEEIVRIIKMMPKWQPAQHKGKAVRQSQTIMIPF